MKHVLENEQLRVVIDDHGAELNSIIEKTTNTEYLWQGDERYWTGQAILLFPICGRLVEGRYTYKGESYDMSIHGFIRNVDLTVENKTATAITLTYTDNEFTRAQYPFAFRYSLTYTLVGNKLTHSFVVENTGDEVLPFGIGGHPGFNVPLAEGETFEDYSLCFDAPCAPKAFVLDGNTCSFTGEFKELSLIEGQWLPLTHSLFDEDAIFVKDMAPAVTLCSKVSNRSIRLDYPEYPYVGFWHCPKTEAPFVCIEPWVMGPSQLDTIEDIMEKADLIHLLPGQGYRNTYTITVE